MTKAEIRSFLTGIDERHLTKRAETFGAEYEEMCQMCGEKADGMIDEKFSICHVIVIHHSVPLKEARASRNLVQKIRLKFPKKICMLISTLESGCVLWKRKDFHTLCRKDQTGVMYDEEGNKFYSQTPEFLVYNIDNIDDITNWVESDAFGEDIRLFISDKHNEIYTSRHNPPIRYDGRHVVRYFPAKGIGLPYGAETFGADGEFFGKYPATYYQIDEEEGIFYLPATDSYWLTHGEDALTQEQAMKEMVGIDFKSESSGLTRLPSDEPNFDPQKADRNKDGKISSWERTVGNKVAKGIREGRKTSSKGIDTFAEPFEDIGISKTYARLGVIAAGITALAFGVKKLRK